MRQVLVLYCIVFILSLIPVSVFLLLVRQSIVSYLDSRMKKKCLHFFRFFFNTSKYLVYQIIFLWDHSSETIQNTFSLSKDDTCLLSQESETTQIHYFGYSNSETILSIGWYTYCLASVAPLLAATRRSRNNCKSRLNYPKGTFHVFHLHKMSLFSSQTLWNRFDKCFPICLDAVGKIVTFMVVVPINIVFTFWSSAIREIRK
jgi:hypothetical protein